MRVGDLVMVERGRDIEMSVFDEWRRYLVGQAVCVGRFVTGDVGLVLGVDVGEDRYDGCWILVARDEGVMIGWVVGVYLEVVV